METHHTPGKPESTDAPPVAPSTDATRGPVLGKDVSPLWMIFIQVPIGFFLHFLPFVFVCLANASTSRTQLILVASLYCILSIAVAVGIRRFPAARGIGLGMFIGVAVTGWLTGTCALTGLIE